METGGPPVVVVIDDDVDFLEITSGILEQAGYRPVVFSNPQRALEQLPDLAPSLVITDLMMGSINAGFSLSCALRDIPALDRVPIIMVTAVQSRLGFDFRPMSADDLAAMHVAAFLEKPVHPKVLLKKVAEVLAAGKPAE